MGRTPTEPHDPIYVALGQLAGRPSPLSTVEIQKHQALLGAPAVVATVSKSVDDQVKAKTVAQIIRGAIQTLTTPTDQKLAVATFGVGSSYDGKRVNKRKDHLYETHGLTHKQYEGARADILAGITIALKSDPKDNEGAFIQLTARQYHDAVSDLVAFYGTLDAISTVAIVAAIVVCNTDVRVRGPILEKRPISERWMRFHVRATAYGEWCMSSHLDGNNHNEIMRLYSKVGEMRMRDCYYRFVEFGRDAVFTPAEAEIAILKHFPRDGAWSAGQQEAKNQLLYQAWGSWLARSPKRQNARLVTAVDTTNALMRAIKQARTTVPWPTPDRWLHWDPAFAWGILQDCHGAGLISQELLGTLSASATFNTMAVRALEDLEVLVESQAGS